MEYRERHKLANDIKNETFVEVDKCLLKKHIPNSDLLHKSLSSCDTLAFELVFVLLDVVSAKQIKDNRKSFNENKSIEILPVPKTLQKKRQSKKSSVK